MPSPPKVSNIEHVLTFHIRSYLTKHYSRETIKLCSFTAALITCLFEASVVTFPMFTPLFIDKLHYDQFQINVIGGAMSVGLYLTMPFLGYISDNYGLVLLAMIGLISVPGYFIAALVFNFGFGYLIMAFAFGVIGCATSASYFCSLLTCANIYPERKGLSLSLPVTAYGFSSLVLSNLFKSGWFKRKQGGEFDIHLVFLFLSGMYAVVGCLNWVASCIATIEKDILFKFINCEGETDVDEPCEITPLLTPIRSGVDEVLIDKSMYSAFLKDPTMKLMYITILLFGGVIEVFMTNLGSLTVTVGQGPLMPNGDVASQVITFSLFSTLMRLVMSVLNDYYNDTKAMFKLVLGSLGVLAIGYILVAINFDSLFVVSAFIGAGCGSIYTVIPNVVATVWGVEILGSTWGLFLSAPAFGSFLFSMLYAFEFDQFCNVVSNDGVGGGLKTVFTRYCLTIPFTLFSLGVIMSGLLMVAGWRMSWSKKFQ